MVNSLVSVLIPAYNHENYVQETIKSIINQTYKNIELIVVDDGSKDATWQKIQEMHEDCEKRFVRVHFETKANEGTCATLNKLIALAEGEYVYMIASDDIAKQSAIEKQVNFLINNPDYVLAVGDSDLIDGSSNIIGWDDKQNSVNVDTAKFKTFGAFLQAHNKDIDFNSEQFGKYETFVRKNYIPGAFTVKTDNLRKIGGYKKEAPLEDWYLHMQLSKLGKYKYIDEVLYSYRWHGNNTIKKKDYMEKIARQTLLYEQQLVNSLPDKHWKELFDKNINEVKMKFQIGNFIKLYRVKGIDYKKYILEISGHKFCIKQ